MMSKKFIKLLFSLLVIFWLVPNAFAADILHRLTHGDQYALAFGSVLSSDDRTLVIEVKKVISGKRVSSPVRVATPGRAVDLKAGDHVVISLEKKGAKFKLKWGVFKVSPGEISTLKVLAGPLPAADLAALQRYINSGGKAKNFYFIENKVFLRNPDGTSTQIYPLAGQKPGAKLPATLQ